MPTVRGPWLPRPSKGVRGTPEVQDHAGELAEALGLDATERARLGLGVRRRPASSDLTAGGESERDRSLAVAT